MKGAVQGLATMTARTPVTSEPASPSLGAPRTAFASAMRLPAVNS